MKNKIMEEKIDEYIDLVNKRQIDIFHCLDNISDDEIRIATKRLLLYMIDNQSVDNCALEEDNAYLREELSELKDKVEDMTRHIALLECEVERYEMLLRHRSEDTIDSVVCYPKLQDIFTAKEN